MSIDVKLKDKGAQADILKLQQMLQRLAMEDPDIAVRVSAAAAKREFKDLSERITVLDAQSVVIETEAEAKVALAQLEELQRAVRNLDRSTANVDVDIDTQGALAHLAAMKVAIEAIQKEKIDLDPERKNTKTLNQISAAAQRASGTIRGLTTAIIALGPGLVPITGVLLTGILGLAAGLAAAGAGATLFGVVAVNAFTPIVDVIKKMNTAQDQYNQAVTDKQKETALKKLKALYESLDPSQRAVVDGYFKMRDAWGKFVDQFRPQIFQMAAEAMQAFTRLIPHLAPLMQNATNAIHQLQTESISTFQNPVWTKFFQNLTTGAEPAILSLGRSILNLATGFAGVLNAFFPFSNTLTGGLENLTKRFADWGAGLENNPGFKNFIAYVQENTPLVLGLLGSLVKFIADLSIAAAPIGTQVVGAIDALFRGFSKLTDLNPILGTIVLAVLAFSAVFVNMIGPILAVVNIVNLLIPLFAGIGEAISVAWVGIQLFALAWGATIAVIAAVIAALVLAYTHFDTFRSKVDALWQKLVEVGNAILTAVTPALQEVISFFQDEWGKFLAWWNDNSETFSKAWENIQTAAETALSWLVDRISGALDSITSVWSAVWPGLSTVLVGVWTVISGVISGALQVIRGIFMIFTSAIAGDWSGVWDGLGDIVFGAFGIVSSIIMGGIQIILGVLQILWVGIQAAFGAAFDGVVAGLTTSVELVKAVFTGIWDFLVFLFESIITSGQGFVDAIIGAFQWLYDVLIGNSIIPDLVNGVIQWFTALGSFLMAVMGPVIDVIVAGWELIWSVVSTVAVAIWNVVSAQWNAISQITSAIWNALVTLVGAQIKAVYTVVSSVLSALGSTWSSIWNAIGSVAQVVWNLIKALVQAGIVAVKAVVTATMQILQGDWSGAWNTIKAAASTIWGLIKSAVQTAIKAVWSVIVSTLTTIKTAWSNAWDNVLSALGRFASQILTAATDLVSDILNAFTGLASDLYNAGVDMLVGLKDGILSAGGMAVDAVEGIISKIAGLLPGSPADWGPLSGHGYIKLRGERFMEDLTSALRKTSGLEMSMRDVADIMTLRMDSSAAFDRIANSTAGAFNPQPGASNINVEAGAVVVSVGDGVDPEAARKAFDDSADTLGEALLSAIKKR
jgi:phage-related protein